MSKFWAGFSIALAVGAVLGFVLASWFAKCNEKGRP